MNELEKRKMVESLYKGDKSASEIFALLKHENISRATIYRAVKRLQYGISMSRKEGSGRKVKDQTKIDKKKITDRLRRNPAQSIRKIAREIKIPVTSARNILKRDLKLTPRKKDCKQALNSPQKKKRRTRSLKLYRGLAGDVYWRVLFSDEKNFYLDQPLNRQYDRVYIRKGQKSP